MKKIFFIPLWISLGIILMNQTTSSAQCISNVIISTDSVSCYGERDGSITVEVVDGVGPY